MNEFFLYDVIKPAQEVDGALQPSTQFLFAKEFGESYKNGCRTVRINSEGGDIIGGLGIHSMLKSRGDVTVIIDSTAASIAGLIACAGNPTKIRRNARVMIHRGSGLAWGDADQMRDTADELVMYEDMIANIMSARMKMGVEKFKEEFFDGKNHWLTADECLARGLADEVIDDLVATNCGDPAAHYKEILKLKPNTHTNMSKPNWWARIGFKNESSEAEVNAKVEETITENEALKREIAEVKAVNETLKAADNARKAADEAAKDAEDKTELENALKQGRFKAEMLPHYTASMKQNREATRAIINSLPIGKSLAAQAGGTGGEDRSGWTYMDWAKKDSKGLQNMKTNSPEMFKALKR